MNEIYWLTRLDHINLALTFIVFFSAAAILFSGMAKNNKKTIRCVSIIFFVLSSLLLIFIPNQREALMIWGVGGTIDYIKSNETAKQLPDKCIKALDKFVDEYMLNEENNKEK